MNTERLQVKKYKQKTKNGFTLVEIMVSLSIFVMVMTVVMGATLGIFDINAKAQSKKTALDNVNFALETMSRTIRFGTNYHCGTTGNVAQPNDCVSGQSFLTVTDSSGSLITYGLSNGAITRKIGNGTAYAVTSPEVTVQTLTFRVFGTASYSTRDTNQPQVIVTVSAIAGGAIKPKTQSTFKLETTISQRKLDII